MKIYVLGGGPSAEREVSLRSAHAVAAAAREAGFEVEGLETGSNANFLDTIDSSDVVLPIYHGVWGEDGGIQKELEKRNLAFLGSGSESSANCFDKWKTREILQGAKLPVARGAVVTPQIYKDHELSLRPHVLKIIHGGSSIGTLIVKDPSNVSQEKIDEIFSLEHQAVIEELIDGVELTVPILDQNALTPIEIIPPEGGEFDYLNKYNGKSQELCPPKNVSEDTQTKAKSLAEQVHKTMECRHLSRVDMILEPNGNLVILEINTIPGLTEQSLFPKAAAVAGMDMPALVTNFIGMVRRDYGI